MSETLEFTSRYGDAPPPAPWAMCRGHCEGVGIHPMIFSEWAAMGRSRPYIVPQLDAEDRWEIFPPFDGYLFVVCGDCKGTGRRYPEKVARLLTLLYGYFYPLSWLWMYRRLDFFEPETRWARIKGTVYMIRFSWNEYRSFRKVYRRS